MFSLFHSHLSSLPYTLSRSLKSLSERKRILVAHWNERRYARNICIYLAGLMNFSKWETSLVYEMRFTRNAMWASVAYDWWAWSGDKWKSVFEHPATPALGRYAARTKRERTSQGCFRSTSREDPKVFKFLSNAYENRNRERHSSSGSPRPFVLSVRPAFWNRSQLKIFTVTEV